MKMEVDIQHTLIADRYLWGPWHAPPPGDTGQYLENLWLFPQQAWSKGLRPPAVQWVEASDAVHHPVVQRVAPAHAEGEKSCLTGPE